MARDPDSPEELLRVSTEVEAASIMTALAEYDIKATMTGGFTSSFRAEAPGQILVLVRHADIERANAALSAIRSQQQSIDWSTVDVGEDMRDAT